MVPEPVWTFFRREKYFFKPQIVQFVACVLSTLSQLAMAM